MPLTTFPLKVTSQSCLFVLYTWFPLVECGQYLTVTVPCPSALATVASACDQVWFPVLPWRSAQISQGKEQAPMYKWQSFLGKACQVTGL